MKYSAEDLNVTFYLQEEVSYFNESDVIWNDTLNFAPPGPPPLEILLPVTIIYCTTFIVGLVGNVLVIVTIRRCRRLHNATNLFLRSLATADLLLVAVVIPFQTPTYFSWRWELGEFMCKMLSYLTLLSSSCSVFTLAVLSIERYVVIVHPLLAQSHITTKKTHKVIVAVWVVAMVFSFPPLYYKRQFSWDFPGHPTYHTCATYWPVDVLGKVYALYLLIGMYVAPLVVMAYCYARIILEVRLGTRQSAGLRRRSVSDSEGGSDSNTAAGHHSLSDPSNDGAFSGGPADAERPQARYSKTKRDKRQEQDRKQVIAMLILIIVLFMVCWGPLLWLVFLIEFGFVSRFSHVRTLLAIAFNLLSYVNSCLNPICYALMSRTFRRSVLWSCRSCCRRRRRSKKEQRHQQGDDGFSRSHTEFYVWDQSR